MDYLIALLVLVAVIVFGALISVGNGGRSGSWLIFV
jgi:hypothetical protein